MATTYPCHRCNMNEGSPVCLQDSRCPSRVISAPQAQGLGRVKINGMDYTRPVIKVAKVTLDGVTCVVPIGDLYDLLEGGQEYTVRVETMPVRDFERLAEFTGW
ncbi:MAG: hypothetical protein INF98_06135 [Roseomonas sp.]|nr:hypothetical protein [Roseomonas sp.]